MENGEKKPKLTILQELGIFAKWALILWICFALILYVIIEIIALSIPEVIDAPDIRKYSNASLYATGEYKTLITDNEGDYDSYMACAIRCEKYLPKSNFEYSDYVKGFYIYYFEEYGYNTISFVLELKFDDTDTYENFISYETTRCQYEDSFDISRNNYNFLVAIHGKFTSYYFGKENPYQVCMLGKNQETLTVRYICFNQFGDEVSEDFREVFNHTNCEW